MYAPSLCTAPKGVADVRASLQEELHMHTKVRRHPKGGIRTKPNKFNKLDPTSE